MRHSPPIVSSDPSHDMWQDVADEADAEPGEPADDAGAEVRAFSAGAAQHGERLDRVLAQLVPEFSRSYLQQLIAAGAVRVDGAAATKVALRLKAGVRGTIELRPTTASQAFRAEPMKIVTVHEDEHLRVVDKPAGLVVHPAPGNWGGTLLNGLLALDPKAALLPRAGIVHRLDKDTSGLMLVARTRIAMDALVSQIAAREVHRGYLALAHGRWSGAPSLAIDAPIGRDPRNRLRMAVVDLARTPGKAACTQVELLQSSERGCLVRCVLDTGRTHQIRVHMASIGHPLVADPLYGGALAAGLQRQALHARHLNLAHPVTGVALQFESPLPPDLQAALAAWGFPGAVK